MLLVFGVTSVFTLMAENVDDDLFEDENETAVDGGGDIYERSVVPARAQCRIAKPVKLTPSRPTMA
jgi:hypothetical protein